MMRTIDGLRMTEEFFVMIRRDNGTPVGCRSFETAEEAIVWAKNIIMSSAYPTYKADIEIHASANLCEISWEGGIV